MNDTTQEADVHYRAARLITLIRAARCAEDSSLHLPLGNGVSGLLEVIEAEVDQLACELDWPERFGKGNGEAVPAVTMAALAKDHAVAPKPASPTAYRPEADRAAILKRTDTAQHAAVNLAATLQALCELDNSGGHGDQCTALMGVAQTMADRLANDLDVVNLTRA